MKTFQYILQKKKKRKKCPVQSRVWKSFAQSYKLALQSGFSLFLSTWSSLRTKENKCRSGKAWKELESVEN